MTLERSLSIPRTKTKTLSPRGFYLASSAAWNALPMHLRDPELSLNSFKTKLKLTFFLTPPGLHLSFNLFVVYANVIFYKFPRASVCIELNWIELTLQLWWSLQTRPNEWFWPGVRESNGLRLEWVEVETIMRPFLRFPACGWGCIRWKAPCRKGCGWYVKLTWLALLSLYYIL